MKLLLSHFDIYIYLNSVPLKWIMLYLTLFSERESQSLKMCYTNIHLNLDLFILLLTNIEYANYCA